MNAKAFIDTNIFIYLYSVDEEEKNHRASDALEKYNCVISTQTLNEFSNFCIKKWKLEPADISLAITEMCTACSLEYIDEGIVQQALQIHGRYGYAFYDCLMLASALASGCKYLFSEDMADGQIINGTLEIVNILSRDVV